MRCLIFSNGPMDNYDLPLKPYDLLICADGGVRHAAAYQVVPDYIVGDMDSADPDLIKDFEKKGSKVFRYPVEKDEVDTELALQIALDLFEPEEIYIYGGLGSRLDHTLANIHLLSYPAAKGIKVYLADDKQQVSLVTSDLAGRVNGKGVVFSLLPLTSNVVGVKIKGAFWELEGAKFAIGKPYGVSNTVVSDYAEIFVKEGMLILYELLSGDSQ